MKLEQDYNKYINTLDNKSKEYLNKILDLPITHADFDQESESLNMAMYRLIGIRDFMKEDAFQKYQDDKVLEHFYQLIQLVIDSGINVPKNVINKLDSVEAIIANNYKSK